MSGPPPVPHHVHLYVLLLLLKLICWQSTHLCYQSWVSNTHRSPISQVLVLEVIRLHKIGETQLFIILLLLHGCQLTYQHGGTTFRSLHTPGGVFCVFTFTLFN